MYQWKCGDSFFAKQSSCSFDRAACPNNPLNPLRPSITPLTHAKLSADSRLEPSRIENVQKMIESPHCSMPGNTTRLQSRGVPPNLPRPTLATIDSGTPEYHHSNSRTNGVQTACLLKETRELISRCYRWLEAARYIGTTTQPAWKRRSVRSSRLCCSCRRALYAHRVHEVLEGLRYLHMLADTSV